LEFTTILIIFAHEFKTIFIMAKKKAKEEMIQQPDTSSREENKVKIPVSAPTLEGDESKNSEKTLTIEDFKDTMQVEKMADKTISEESKKLKLLAADRLNSLINEANELGITDVVQILNSDKYGQFYMVYRQ
jgi:hypothetical protein